ncbi:MAG: hypothetical protein LUQ26_05860 [Methylococcaceae bacterium]|nr:hypothetical protein [Methylococcaceae bacterium]
MQDLGVSLSVRNMEDQVYDDALLAKLQQLKTLVASVGGQSILEQVDEKKSDLLARNTGFDLVEGGYYRAIAFDYLRNVDSTPKCNLRTHAASCNGSAKNTV